MSVPNFVTNMVILWRAADKSSKLRRMFSGEGEIHLFFFYFKKIEMRGKDDSEEEFKFMAHLDGHAFEFFFDRFKKDETFITEGMGFSAVKTAFVEKFAICGAPEKHFAVKWKKHWTKITYRNR